MTRELHIGEILMLEGLSRGPHPDHAGELGWGLTAAATYWGVAHKIMVREERQVGVFRRKTQLFNTIVRPKSALWIDLGDRGEVMVTSTGEFFTRSVGDDVWQKLPVLTLTTARLAWDKVLSRGRS